MRQFDIILLIIQCIILGSLFLSFIVTLVKPDIKRNDLIGKTRIITQITSITCFVIIVTISLLLDGFYLSSYVPLVIIYIYISIYDTAVVCQFLVMCKITQLKRKYMEIVELNSTITNVMQKSFIHVNKIITGKNVGENYNKNKSDEELKKIAMDRFFMGLKLLQSYQLNLVAILFTAIVTIVTWLIIWPTIGKFCIIKCNFIVYNMFIFISIDVLTIVLSINTLIISKQYDDFSRVKLIVIIKTIVKSMLTIITIIAIIIIGIVVRDIDKYSIYLMCFISMVQTFLFNFDIVATIIYKIKQMKKMGMLKDINRQNITSNLNKIMKTPHLLNAFRKFCMNEFSSENIEFLCMVKKYKKLKPHGKIAILKNIYDTFLTKNSPLELNIDNIARETVFKIKTILDNNPNMDCGVNEINKMESVIVSNISDPLFRFIDTEMYNDFDKIYTILEE